MSRDIDVTMFVADHAGRVDKIVGSEFPAASRKRLASLFAEGCVRVDGKRVKKGFLVRVGQEIRLEKAPDGDEDMRPVPESDGSLDVVYEDADLVVINKPSGIPAHPLLARESGTCANVLVARYPECDGIGDDPREAGLVHRLDIHTSGLLLSARNRETWLTLRSAFGNSAVDKSYLAAVEGNPIGLECHEPLLQNGRRVVVDYAGLPARTSWSKLTVGEAFSLLRCRTHTGRMHQVRAHLAHCGSPIVGDTLYGAEAQAEVAGHFLHAETLRFVHPSSGKEMQLRADMSSNRREWLENHALTIEHE